MKDSSHGLDADRVTDSESSPQGHAQPESKEGEREMRRHQPEWIESVRGDHKQVRPGVGMQRCTICGAVRDWNDRASHPGQWSKRDCTKNLEAE